MTTTRSPEGLLVVERALQAAQLAGDVAALDMLLDDRLVAIGPDGARHTKRDDLDGYRSGFSVITELVEEDVEVLVAGATGVTFVMATVAGTFGGEPLSARLRYTRTWTHDAKQGWRILAAHIAVQPPSSRLCTSACRPGARRRTDVTDRVLLIGRILRSNRPIPDLVLIRGLARV